MKAARHGPPSAPATAAQEAPDSAIIALGALEQLTAERDRDMLDPAVLRILADISGAAELTYWKRDERHAHVMMPALRATPAGDIVDAGPGDTEPLDAGLVERLRLLQDARTRNVTCDLMEANRVAYGLFDGLGLTGVITITYPPDNQAQSWWMSGFMRVVQNFIGALDDAQRDTLTGLLNRKTFEYSMNKILAMQREEHLSPARRSDSQRQVRPGESHWLAVLDIDHFKRINDRFGHLYGDEVLLLLAGLMRRGFRREDRLFRFGGEEFVIALSPCTADNAGMVFDRFRAQVEAHDFPQVGKVTVSLGYSRVRAGDMPTDLVGRADKALYHAKENGRNRVCCYEQLFEAGYFEAPEKHEDVTLF
jgi:diguanylate cyclase (GGDEF)-like protein